MAKKSRKNNSVKLLCIMFAIVFAAMVLNLMYFVQFKSYDAISSDYNPRQAILAKRNLRGQILSSDGQILAMTQLDHEDEIRIYPFGNLFSHVVGYSTYGKTGIEAIANMNLVSSNAPITQKVQNDIDQNKNLGDNVITTLNVRLQEVASKALGVYKGAIVVTNPQTGEVLAMVSKPDFDPNQIENNWDEIIADEESSVLVNRATQGLYPPGSTFKIIDALEYYRENQETYMNYSYSCNGKLKFDDRKISCYHGTAHGTLDLTLSFAKSCNCSFGNMGLSFNRTKFAATLDSLLFNKELPLSIPYSQSTIAVSEQMDTNDLVQSVIGQGTTQMTPIHLNMITCAAANNGILMQPHFITEIENCDGETIKSYEPKEYAEIMTQKEAAYLTELMESVITEGTGDFLKDADYTCAGKTGSAEYSSEKGNSHAWFTGFAPATNPQICVTVIIEGAGSGGDYAVPVAKRIFDAYFEQME